MEKQLYLIRKYQPYLFFDRNEPFFPVEVGYTVFEKDCASPSFDRTIEFTDPVRRIIEYAIYWDFDIEHMYDLGHVWVYIDGDGEVCECESSFHGTYLRSLLRDRSNIDDQTHVRLYSQPGKHAFFPSSSLFDLLPRKQLYAPAWDGAGSGGLLIPHFLRNSLSTNEKRNTLVRAYLQRMRFVPSMLFERYVLPEDIFQPWPELLKKIPRLIESKLEEIRINEDFDRE